MTYVETLQPYSDFEIKGKLSWYESKDSSFYVKQFNYKLTQYAPSVYAEIYFTLPDDEFMEFKQIDSLAIKDRIVEVWFEPELYNAITNKSYFPGPFKFCVVNYSYIKTGAVTDYELRGSDLNFVKIIKLECVDPVFYQMTLQDKIRSFGKTTVSEVTEKILKENGAKIKRIDGTSYAFPWLQTQITDYEMIRSMLPYAKSSEGNLVYHLLLFNEEAYFCPISNSEVSDFKTVIDMDKTIDASVVSYDQKVIIEKYGSREMKAINSGHYNFNAATPEKMNKQSYVGGRSGLKQHADVGLRYINGALDDEELSKIYVSNLRQRIHTFSRILNINTLSIPEITPFHCVELISQENGDTKEMDGLYYVGAVDYRFSNSNVGLLPNTMSLYLFSEVDSKGAESPEGSAIK